MRDVTTEDIKACIRKNGLLGLNTSELRQLLRETADADDFAAQVMQTTVRQVLVSKLEQGRQPDALSLQSSSSAGLLAEYTRLHEELADMLTSGRISQTHLKGDYLWLVDALERINTARLALGIKKVSVN